MKKALAIILSVLMAISVMPMAFAADGHGCADEDCLVCYIADLINSLPRAEEITAENAAEVTDTLHAIDCVKFDLSDEEYEELLALVETEESAVGGMDVPKAYSEALNAIVNLEEGCSLYISKMADIEGIKNYDLSESVVAFEIKGSNGYKATVSLQDAVQGVFTLNESQAQNVDFNTATLASFDGYYTMDAQGWTYSYRLPAGTYTIKEVTESMIVNGKEYSGFDVSCNGEDANDGYTVTLTEDDKGIALFTNTYKEFQLYYFANNGNDEDVLVQDFNTVDNPLQIAENEFTYDGYTFTGWNTKKDGSGKSFIPGKYYDFSNTTILYAQWEENKPSCTHDNIKEEITARPESTDGGLTWTKGEKTYTCDCGHTYTEEADRADYVEYAKAALEFASLMATEGLTPAAKVEIAAEYANLGELQQDLITDEQKIVDDYTDALKALNEKIKAKIADGSYIKADTSEAEALITEIEEAGIVDEEIKAEFEEIKAEIEKIKADENASKAEYDEVLKDYVSRLTEIKAVSGKCNVCGTFHENFIYVIICFIIRIFRALIGFFTTLD